MTFALSWVFTYDVVLEALFAIITFIVAMLGYKVYKATKKLQPLYLATAFLMISISNILQSILNFLILTELNKEVCDIMRVQSINAFNTAGIYINIFFMIIGLSILTFMTLKAKDIKGLVVISVLALLGVFLSFNPIHTYHLFSSILLIIISGYFANNFLKNTRIKAATIMIAFFFLLFGNLYFMFTINHQIGHFVGQIFNLIAYSLVLINFLMVLRR